MECIWIVTLPNCPEPTPEPTDPPAEVCETAYGCAYPDDDCYGHELNRLPGVNSNNWGWWAESTGEGDHVFTMYAGAGNNDISKATYVGDTTVKIDDEGRATVYTEPTDNCRFDAVHVHVGTDYPRDKRNNITTAPGLYKISQVDPSNTYYMVVHVDACCTPPH